MYRLPLTLDPLLRDLDPERGLPFKDAPAPDVFVSIFRQLWGVCRGPVLVPVSVETPNCGGDEIVAGVEGEEEKEDEGNKEENGDLDGHMNSCVDMNSYEVEKKGDLHGHMNSYEDMNSCMSVEVAPVEKVVKAKRAAGAGSPTPTHRIMTADTGLETQGSMGVEVIGPPATWQFDFGDSFGDSCGGLTDEDTVTSMASKETLAWSSRGDKQEMGSYGVHGDAQRESLRRVEESKDFARAVKADDAEIPIHLLNDRVRVSSELRKGVTAINEIKN